MRRTLQTTGIALKWLIDRGVPVLPDVDWQEKSDMPCDTGTAITTIAMEFPEYNFDTLAPDYPAKTGRWAFSREAVLQRGIDCRRWLRSRPENVIAVVSHCGFLRTAVCHSDFANADYRIFEFVSDSTSHELVEWASTEEAGGGMGHSPRGRFLPQPLDFQYFHETNTKTVDDNIVDEVRNGTAS